MTLTDEAVVEYKVDAPYEPGLEGGILWNDPALGIGWPVKDPLLSEKDRGWPGVSGILAATGKSSS